ncbi:MAG: hypothetical protein QM741_08495 [Rudaea sp.]
MMTMVVAKAALQAASRSAQVLALRLDTNTPVDQNAMPSAWRLMRNEALH